MKVSLDLSGKNVLITGSAQGLGKTLAQGVLAAGAGVILNDVNAEKLRETAAAFREEGCRVFDSVFDVTNEEEVEKAVDDIERNFGSIDVLINNAGIHKRNLLVDMPVENWRRVIDVNLTSMFIVGRAVAKRMISRGSGKIINIVSINAQLVRPEIGNYCAAKGGVVTLTKSMATEWGRYGINANAIGPGYMLTDLTRPLAENSEFDSWVRSEVPLGRWGAPEDIVGAVILLSSSASDYISGQTIYIDGGWQSCL